MYLPPSPRWAELSVSRIKIYSDGLGIKHLCSIHLIERYHQYKSSESQRRRKQTKLLSRFGLLFFRTTIRWINHFSHSFQYWTNVMFQQLVLTAKGLPIAPQPHWVLGHAGPSHLDHNSGNQACLWISATWAIGSMWANLPIQAACNSDVMQSYM